MFNWKSSPSQENKAMRKRYDAFLQQHGELYNDSVEPLTQADILDIEKRKRKLKKIWYFLLSLSGVIALAYLLFPPYSPEDMLNVVWLLGVVGVGGALLVRHFNNALKYNEKRVIKGVITAKVAMKYDEDHGCYVEMSGREKFKISPKDYRKCELGEIISIEMLTDDATIKRKVVKLGKI